MKVRGVVKGQTIELETPAGLPEGQQVEVEICVAAKAAQTEDAKERPAPYAPLTPEELDAKIASDPKFEEMRKAREFRNKLEKQWGGKLNLSVQDVREDRDR